MAIAGAETAGTDAPTESPKSVGLPAVDFGAPAPLAVRGYPTPIQLGMRDYATIVAYTKDGSEVLACGNMTPMGPAKGAELADSCYFAGAGAKKTQHFGVEEGPTGPRASAGLIEKLGRVREGVRSDLRRDQATNTLHPPPLKGTWPFAKDIALSVTQVEGKGGGSVLRVGGSVTGQDPVYPVTLAEQSKIPEVTYSGEWNAIVASPDDKELSFIGHFFCMEWCNDIVITRLAYGKLASLVFNDTGFRLHQKKDYAGSRDLFLKATWADPKAPLPPYNLACAYALLGDEANAAKALKLAISVGGEKVKARAKKDADFKGALSAKWFRDLTG